MTLIEAQSHFSMWCMFQSPLVATNDVRLGDKDIDAILINPETIGVNQDALGAPPFRIDVGHQPWRGDLRANPREASVMQWARRLANGDVAVLVLNRDDKKTQDVTLYFADFLDGQPGGKYAVRDIQARKSYGQVCEKLGPFPVEPHQTMFARLTPVDSPCAEGTRLEV